MRIRAIVLAVTAVGCACRPAIPPATAPAQTAAVRDAGKVAFRFLVDPSAMTSSAAKMEELVSPRPTADLPLPNYPEAALAAQAGAAHVVVRILIDKDGRIQDVTDSPVASSSSGPFSGDFRDAVLRALRHWRFTPGHFDHYEDGPDSDDDGKPDYRRLVRSVRVPVRYDVRFDFEVIDGVGRVRTTATGQ